MKKFAIALLALPLGACVTTPSPFSRCDHYTDINDWKACADRVQTERIIQSQITSLRLEMNSRNRRF